AAPAFLVLVLAAAAILIAIAKCLRARRMGAIPISLAFIANGILCVNDMAVIEGAMDGIELMPLGYLVLMFAHGLVMGAKREHAVLDRGQALTESERRVRILTDNLPVVLFQIAAEPRGQFRTLYVSHGIERLTGQAEMGSGDALLAFRDL